MSKIKLTCNTCNKQFEKEKKEYNRRKKLGKTKFYCSLSCSGKTQEQLNHLQKIRENSETYPIWIHSSNRIDEFSPFRETFKRVRGRSKDYNIDLEYLKDLWESQDGICPFTGWKLQLPSSNKEYKLVPYTASLDRIDNSQGYIKGNVRFVSVIFNFARHTFSDQDVIDFAAAIIHGDELVSTSNTKQ